MSYPVISADQDRDGVSAEVIYPTVGMMLCNHPDFDYKHACFDAYNRWIAEDCSSQPERLLGCGQTAMRTPAEGVQDIKNIKALGLRGVMMTGDPAMNWRLMWANDFPHSDSTWPWSQKMLAEQSKHLTTEQRRAVLCDNVADLCHIDLTTLKAAA